MCIFQEVNEMLKNKKGQSTLEYVILVTGVIAVLLAFLRPTGTFNNALTNTLTQGTNGMEDMAGRLRDSRPTAP